MAETNRTDDEGRSVAVLLVSSREWFASALQAVLEPEGFTFRHLRSAEEAVSGTAALDPDVVIIDEGLPDVSAAELCRRLLAAGLGASVPILVYSPNLWKETEQAEAMRAGAWDVIREPIRSRILVAKLHRLLHLKELIESSEQSALADPETGLYSLAGLMHSLPVLGSLAERSGSPVCCSVVGPTVPAEEQERLALQRLAMAGLVRRFTRASDLCALVGGADVALIVYNADTETAATIVQRLSERAGDSADLLGGEAPLSAGIADLRVAGLGRPPVPTGEPGSALAEGSAERVARLARLAAAQTALSEARALQGGIRIAPAD